MAPFIVGFHGHDVVKLDELPVAAKETQPPIRLPFTRNVTRDKTLTLMLIVVAALKVATVGFPDKTNEFTVGAAVL